LFDSLIISKATVDEPQVKMLEDLTIISDEKGEVVGFNLFNVSRDLTLHESFQSFNHEVLAYIKKRLEPYYPFNQETQFVVGHVESSEVIPDTHLHKTRVNVGTEVLDIVCGAQNIAQDEYVVVSLPGS
jgi:tRNA-binding protein